jgi:hypothetical protein
MMIWFIRSNNVKNVKDLLKNIPDHKPMEKLKLRIDLAQLFSATLKQPPFIWTHGHSPSRLP